MTNGAAHLPPPLCRRVVPQGKLVRRVMVPGASLQNIGLIESAGARARLLHAQLVEAWQASLPFVLPDVANDRVVDVIAARRTRVVVMTNRHTAYLFAKQHSTSVPSAQRAQHGADVAGPSSPAVIPGNTASVSVTYKVKWVIPNELIDNIRSVENTYRISIEYRLPISVRADQTILATRSKYSTAYVWMGISPWCCC